MEWAANKVDREFVSPYHGTCSVEDGIEASVEFDETPSRSRISNVYTGIDR